MAEADEDLFSYIVQAFASMESPENCHPLREWLKDIMAVFDNFLSLGTPDTRKLADIANLMESLKSAQVFLWHFNCKTLFAHCKDLLAHLIAATDLKEVDDEVKCKTIPANNFTPYIYFPGSNPDIVRGVEQFAQIQTHVKVR
jgi:hypothetical protein